MGTVLSSRVAVLEKLAGHSAEEWQALMEREGITPEMQREIVADAMRELELAGDTGESYQMLTATLQQMDGSHATV